MTYGGENFVILSGLITKPTYKVYDSFFSDGGGGFYNATLRIPFGNRSQTLKIGAKGLLAQAMNDELKEGSYIKIHGHIEEKSYEGSCKHCGGPERKYWTEVQVDNYIILN